jgi:hypothetical protein
MVRLKARSSRFVAGERRHLVRPNIVVALSAAVILVELDRELDRLDAAQPVEPPRQQRQAPHQRRLERIVRRKRRREVVVVGGEIVAALIHRHDMPRRQPVPPRVKPRISLSVQVLRSCACQRVAPVRRDLRLTRHLYTSCGEGITHMAVNVKMESRAFAYLSPSEAPFVFYAEPRQNRTVITISQWQVHPFKREWRIANGIVRRAITEHQKFIEMRTSVCDKPSFSFSGFLNWVFVLFSVGPECAFALESNCVRRPIERDDADTDWLAATAPELRRLICQDCRDTPDLFNHLLGKKFCFGRNLDGGDRTLRHVKSGRDVGDLARDDFAECRVAASCYAALLPVCAVGDALMRVNRGDKFLRATEFIKVFEELNGDIVAFRRGAVPIFVAFEYPLKLSQQAIGHRV